MSCGGHHFRRRRQSSDRPLELAVRVSQVSGQGAVRVRLVSGSDPFWLPGQFPVTWLSPPRIGETVIVRVPRWLATRTREIVASRTSCFQPALNLTQLPSLNPELASKEGSFRVADESG